MGGVVNQIADTVDRISPGGSFGKNGANALRSANEGNWTDAYKNASAIADPMSGLNKYTGGSASPFSGNGGNVFNTITNAPTKPDAPGTDPSLAAVEEQQLTGAEKFRKDMPSMQSKLGSQLARQGQGLLNQNLKDSRSQDSSRGLLYGGLHAGREGAQRSQMANSLAEGRSKINSSVSEAADQLDAQAVDTALGVQRSQTAIQNDIYSQALSSMQTQNAGMNGLMKGGGSIFGSFLGGR